MWKGRFVHSPTFQAEIMLRDARMAAMTGRTAASWGGGERQQWADGATLQSTLSAHSAPSEHVAANALPARCIAGKGHVFATASPS